MDEFPFEQDDWGRVYAVSTALTNAALADDDVLYASLFEDLLEVLESLRRKCGKHPILIETAADFCDDPTARERLYRDAIQLAEANALSTMSIRLSLASLLLLEIGEPAQAMQQLKACEVEVSKDGDDYERQNWIELMDAASKQIEGRGE